MKYFFPIFLFICLPAFAKAKILDEKDSWQRICCSKHNTVYAGGRNAFRYFENNKSHLISLKADLQISALYTQGDHVLIGTKTGDLFIYAALRDSLRHIANAEAEISNIRMIAGRLYITTLGRGYAELSPGRLRYFNTSNFLKDNYIYDLVPDGSGGIWGCSDEGIFFVKDTVEYPAWNAQLSDKIITALAYRNGMLCCGTQKGGLSQIGLQQASVFHYDEKIWKGATINDIQILDRVIMVANDMGAFLVSNKFRNKIDTLVHNKKIKDLQADHAGAIWIAGENYLAVHYPEYFQLISRNVKFVHALIADKNKGIWFTPDEGLSLFNTETHEVQDILPPGVLRGTDITCFYIDTHENLWAGTSDEGLFHYRSNDGKLTKISIDHSPETSQVLSLSGKGGEVWVSTLNGVWYSNINDEANRFYSLEEKLKLRKNYVYNIMFDKEENLWLATDGHGILKIKGGRVENLSRGLKIGAKVFYSILQDRRSNIWLNAYLNGLYCVTRDSVYHLGRENGLQSSDILAIHPMNDTHIVAVSAAGIDVISTRDFSVTQIPFTIGAQQFVPELNSITGAGNEVYIGTDKGILQFRLPSYIDLPRSRPFISSVEVLGQPVTEATHQFGHKENYIKFNIASGNTFEEKTWLRYKLQGLNENWTATLDNEIAYSQLNPGRYSFQLQSANNVQFANAYTTSYSFSIGTPFWRKWWFVALLLIATVVSVWQYIRYRERKVSALQLLAKEKAIAEFEVLKAQINPHFLFNSFNTLIQVIDDSKEMAIDYTQHLSDFYRSLIAFKEHDLVTLEKDLEILGNYFYLQKMRFGNSLNFTQEIGPDELQQLMIPPLTLQMLAENAIKHNAISQNKILKIRLFAEGDDIVFENNLQLKMTNEKGEGLGLQNIRNRYRQYSKREVKIIQTDHYFTVRLPKILNDI